MLVFGHFDSLGQSHLAGQVAVDSIEEVWWLGWTAFAVPHGHNVFLAQWQNYPAGENFGVNGSMLFLGVLFAPITKVFGPIVTWNIALRFALAISATSMCFVLRRWVTWWPAAFVGGLLYGFSAYVLTYASGYLFLVFVPLPPVFFLLLHEILVRQRWRPSRVGALLGLVCFFQFFIWSEVLAGMVIVGAIATCLYVLVKRHRLEDTWRYAVKSFAFAGAVGGVLLVVPGAFTLFGPQNTHGSPTAAVFMNAFPSDMLGSIVPHFQWLSTNGLTANAITHMTYSSAEYIGIPMIVVLACFAILLRKKTVVLFAGAMALITYILSLGSHLWIDGHKTPVPLPWAVLGHLPVLGGFTPVRFSLYTGLFIAAMFSIGLDEVRRRLRAAGGLGNLSPGWRAFGASGASVVIAAAVILPLVPAHAQPAPQTNIPSFFTSGAVDAIPEGGVVLAYPYPDWSGPGLFFQVPHNIMLDQAASGMRFKLIGGYGWFPSPTGSRGTTRPAVLNPRSVQEMFDDEYWNLSGKSLPSRTGANADLRAFLTKYGVAAVVLQPLGGDPAAVVRYVTGAIGCPAYFSDVAVWLHVKQRLADRVPGKNVNTCGRPAEAAPQLFRPGNGSTVSGGTYLDANTVGFLRMASIDFYLSGGSLHDKLIGRGVQTPIGWLALWNTRTVPNGRYVLRSVAVDSVGSRRTSAGSTITVKN
jgi:hypothetical protein